MEKLNSGISIPFHTLRNISSKPDKGKLRSFFIGLVLTKDLAKLDLNNDANVRGYLNQASDGSVKSKPTGLHARIMGSLEMNPDEFHFKNNGIKVVADKAIINEGRNQLFLENPSISNGWQTYNVIKLFHEGWPHEEAYVKVEVNSFRDEEDRFHLKREVSIGSNVQNKVQDISIYGLKNIFNDLQNNTPNWNLKLDESQKQAYDTLKLCQLLFLILPKDIWENELNSFKKIKFNKALVYSSKKRWMDLFAFIKEKKDEDKSIKIIYSIFLDIADDLIFKYEELKKCNAFNSRFLKKNLKEEDGIKRDDNENVILVQDGWLFPIISSLSVFIKKVKNKWILDVPDDFNYEGLICCIFCNSYKTSNNPQLNGKNPSAYSASRRDAIYNDRLEDWIDEAKTIT